MQNLDFYQNTSLTALQLPHRPVCFGVEVGDVGVDCYTDEDVWAAGLRRGQLPRCLPQKTGWCADAKCTGDLGGSAAQLK